ncbi:MAG: phosphatidate cytidylyltransferase [Kiloniellales bacterium]|nr:phosphatidate cytidylyltransferase [Kiloniellales bacterium]
MIDVTARPSAPASKHGLWVRVASAAVLAPPALAALYFGTPYIEILVLAAAAILAWEWSALCNPGRQRLAQGAVIAAVLLAVGCAALREYDIAGWLVAVGAMAAAVASARAGAERSIWAGLGVVYLALPCIGLLWLRQVPDIGLVLVLWLVLLVWATDSAAYFAGRAIGGPRLAPAISPKKTWAGLAGGMLGAALVGAAVGWVVGSERWATIALLSALLAIVEQMGDLLESGIKRRFGVKDAGALIPGHGGLLDRVDGLLVTTLVVSLLVWQKGESL